MSVFIVIEGLVHSQRVYCRRRSSTDEMASNAARLSTRDPRRRLRGVAVRDRDGRVGIVERAPDVARGDSSREVDKADGGDERAMGRCPHG